MSCEINRLCPRLSFPGYLYSTQPWKTASPSEVKSGFVYKNQDSVSLSSIRQARLLPMIKRLGIPKCRVPFLRCKLPSMHVSPDSRFNFWKLGLGQMTGNDTVATLGAVSNTVLHLWSRNFCLLPASMKPWQDDWLAVDRVKSQICYKCLQFWRWGWDAERYGFLEAEGQGSHRLTDRMWRKSIEIRSKDVNWTVWPSWQ